METEEYAYYPPKPEINERNTASIVKTVISLFLFIGLFMLFPVPVNFIFLVVLVLFLHEMGHLIAMKTYGYEDVGMFFIPFIGAVVTGRKENMSQFQRIIIILAGPIPGILIGGFLILMVQYAGWNPYLLVYGVVFIALNVLNLIPLDPLDGGRLFELLFFSFNDIARMLFHSLSSLLMIGVGIYFEAYAIIILGIFLLSRIQSYLKLIKIRKRIKLLDIELNVAYDKLTDKDYWLIRREFLRQSNLSKMIAPDGKDYDEKEEVLAPAIRNLLKPPVNNDVGALGKFIFFVIWVLGIVGSVYIVLPVLPKVIEFFI